MYQIAQLVYWRCYWSWKMQDVFQFLIVLNKLTYNGQEKRPKEAYSAKYYCLYPQVKLYS
jgi:hypothetical protein